MISTILLLHKVNMFLNVLLVRNKLVNEKDRFSRFSRDDFGFFRKPLHTADIHKNFSDFWLLPNVRIRSTGAAHHGTLVMVFMLKFSIFGSKIEA